MADKVQKIREEVERLKEIAEYNLSHSKMDRGAWMQQASVCTNLLSFINSLQEEPVSDDLEDVCEQLAENARKHKAETISPFFSPTDYKKGVMDGANWQKEQLLAKDVDGIVTFDYYDDEDKTYGCIAHDSFCLEDFGLKDRDKVKIIIIKED